MDRHATQHRSWRPSRRWRPWISSLLASLAMLAGLVGPVRPPIAAAYQATADSNVTAFSSGCIGWADPHPARMLSLALNGMTGLGYGVTGYKGTAFTKSHTLSRSVNDWSYYVHTHGDFYRNPDGRYYSGFREDAGKCTSAAIVYSKEIAAQRAGRLTNLVVISTCHNGESNTTLPAAFGIVMSKSSTLSSQKTRFYLGYLGNAFDNDEETFETAFWDALLRGKTVGPAFELARLGSFTHADFGANWWGNYWWTGKAGTGSPCTNCV